MTRRTLGFALVAAGAFMSVGALVAACSSNSANPQPVVYSVTEAGVTEAAVDGSTSSVGHDSGSDSSAPLSSDSSQPSSGDAQVGDGSPADVTNASEAAVDGASCVTDGGCYSCPPATTTEFLNQCTGSTCTPFNNLQRLPDYDGGALPPLQP